MKKVFFAGSFNPFTKGHADIVRRLLLVFDHVFIGIGININKDPDSSKTNAQALQINNWIVSNHLSEKVEVTVYSGLTAKAARMAGAVCLARGVRNSSDFDYEFNLANANRDAFGI